MIDFSSKLVPQPNEEPRFVGSTEVIFMIFVLFSVYSDRLGVNHLSFSKQRKGSGFLDNKVMHAHSRKCRFVLAAQVFPVSVTQKGLNYFVITLRIDQLQACKNG